MPASYRNQLFVSYRRTDRPWLEKLRGHFQPDIRNHRIQYWDDQRLETGDDFRAEIFEAIKHARVALLLVSPAFLQSRFIMEEEVPRILAAIDEGLTLVWLPVSGKFYGADAPPALKPISDRQAAASTTLPLDQLDDAGVQATLGEVARKIRRLLEPDRKRSNLPFESLGPLFKGRSADLGNLAQHVRENRSVGSPRIKVITGMGGIGKTRLALEYARRHHEEFSALLFVSASSPADFAANLAQLSEPETLDLREYKFGNEEDKRAAVVTWLAEHHGWLLICDNVDTTEAATEVKKFAGRLHSGQIIVTSRITTEWGAGQQQIPLETIPLADAVELLLTATAESRVVRASDTERATAIARRLGCLPLALTHSAAYLRYYHESFDDYLAAFERNLAEVLEFGPPGQLDYNNKIATTFFLSFAKLAPMEKAILRAASFLAPEPIPLAMFERAPTVLQACLRLWCAETGEVPAQKRARDAVAELARFSLVTRGDGSFALHRMAQAVLQSAVPAEQRQFWLAQARELLAAMLPREGAEDEASRKTWDAVSAHVEALVADAEGRPVVPADLRLEQALAAYYFGSGSFREAKALYERLLGFHSEKNPETLALRVRLGEALLRLGENGAARSLLGECSDEARRTGRDGSLAAALSFLGIIALNEGEFDECRSLVSESLEIARRLNDPPAIAHALIELGWLNIRTKDAPAAGECFRESLELFRGSAKGVARALGGLGTVADMLGRHGEAKERWLESLSLFRQMGSRQGTSVILNNLGYSARTQGNFEEANRWFQESLQLARDIDDPKSMAIALGNIGHAAVARGHFEEARDAYHKSIMAARAIQAVPWILDSLAGFANVVGHDGAAATALDILGFVDAHPRKYRETSVIVQAALAALRQPPEVVARGFALGRTMTLEQILDELMAKHAPRRPIAPG